jgi:hypothetical protein
MNPTTAAPETLRLQINQPEVIALSQPYGKPCQSRFSGDQLMFTLTDGRKLFVDPYVQDRIKTLGVAPGTPFEIEKQERQQGNRRIVEVVVREVGLPSTAPPAAMAAGRCTPLPSPPVNGAGDTAAGILAAAYPEAVRIALAGVEAARQAGLHISPTFEDVRAIAFSISGLGGRR